MDRKEPCSDVDWQQIVKKTKKKNGRRPKNSWIVGRIMGDLLASSRFDFFIPWMGRNVSKIWILDIGQQLLKKTKNKIKNPKEPKQKTQKSKTGNQKIHELWEDSWGIF